MAAGEVEVEGVVAHFELCEGAIVLVCLSVEFVCCRLGVALYIRMFFVPLRWEWHCMYGCSLLPWGFVQLQCIDIPDADHKE